MKGLPPFWLEVNGHYEEFDSEIELWERMRDFGVNEQPGFWPGDSAQYQTPSGALSVGLCEHEEKECL